MLILQYLLKTQNNHNCSCPSPPLAASLYDASSIVSVCVATNGENLSKFRCFLSSATRLAVLRVSKTRLVITSAFLGQTSPISVAESQFKVQEDC